MHIGVYHPAVSSKEGGGIAIFYRNIGLALANHGQEVTFYTSATCDTHSTLTHPNVDVISVDDTVEREIVKRLGINDHLARSVGFWLAGLRNGIRRQMNSKLDVILTGLEIDDLLLPRFVRTPVIHQSHINLSEFGVGGAVHARFHGSELWLANSRTTARALEKEYGATVNGVVYPGIDLERFSDPIERISDPPQITFIGRVHKVKGVQDLIRAFAALDVDAHLNIVGGGPHRDRFESLAHRLGVEQITFHGFVSAEEVSRYYQEATLAVHPSHHDSFCMTNLEAMAASTPVVTTNLPAIREYAVEDENCRLVSPGDVENLSNVLEELLSSPNDRTRLASAGRMTAEEFTWENQAQEILTYCRGVCE